MNTLADRSRVLLGEREQLRTAPTMRRTSDHPSGERLTVQPRTASWCDAQTLLRFAAHLHFKAVRILDVETAFSPSYHQPATLELRFDRRLDGLVSIPVGQRVRDVIDTDFATRPTTGIARNEDVVPKRQTALCLSVVVGYLHSEETRIEIARFRVVGDLHRYVVDVDGVCRRSGLRGTRRRRRRRRDRERLNELTAGHLPTLVVLQQPADDGFHLLILLSAEF